MAISVVPDPDVISFARGIPSPDMFPVDLLAECARTAVADHGRVALNYGAPGGYEPLREWIAARHGVAPSRIVVTPGSMIGLNLVVRHLCAGRHALVEAPTYDRMLHALADAGAGVATVSRGEGGLDLARLAELASQTPRPALLYVLPTFHNPTGRTLTAAERQALVGVAVEHDLSVFEDDAYGLLRIEGDHEPSLLSLLRAAGREDLGIFSSSFSKSVAPGLRVGYLILPEQLVARDRGGRGAPVRLAAAAAAGPAARVPRGRSSRGAPRSPRRLPATAARRAAGRARRSARRRPLDAA